MDVLGEDQALQAVLGRGDFVGGIDNEALDFSQLEDFINDDNDASGNYFAETLTHEAGARTAPATPSGAVLSVVVQEPAGGGPPPPPQAQPPQAQPGPGGGGGGGQGGAGSPCVGKPAPSPAPAPRLHGPLPPFKADGGVQAYVLAHNLPDSPPDSSSEAPYSPQDPEQKTAGVGPATSLPGDLLLHPGHPGLPGAHHQHHQQHHHQHHHQHHPAMYHPPAPPHHVATLPLLAPSGVASPAPGAGHPPPPPPPPAQTPISLSVAASPAPAPAPALQQLGIVPTSPSMTLAATHVGLTPDANGITAIYSSLQGGTKKRKLSQDSGVSGTSCPSANGPLNNAVHVKQEPELSPDSSSSQTGVLDDEYGFEIPGESGMYLDSSYQCIRFQPFQQTSWHALCDQNLEELPVPHYRVDADKGFNFSNADDAFVCQKKNHFQITCHVQLQGDPRFVKTPEGLKKISSFHLHFYGVKVESPTQTIKVEQSQSDRSKKPFHPVPMDLQGEQVTKVTVGRLHFSETTSNNMRKKGKPNPDQRYFNLVVGLHAHCADSNDYPVVSHSSERIIVRASNPGQFESDVELCWQKGHTSESIFHAGRVGINTDRPDEALVVHGNVKVTGHIVQPSDCRAKESIQECDTREQLRNVQQLRVVRYRYAPEFALHAGLTDPSLVADTGVIAQEVQQVLPEAVRPAGDIILPSGQRIDNFLVVNKERIFMENVGAVKELCKVTDNLETRIDELERMNRKLVKLKRLDSLKSTSSISTVTTCSKTSSITFKHQKRKRGKADENILCSNKFIQITIVILVLVMAFCLVAMATLYFLEFQKRNRQDFDNSLYSHHSGQNRPHPSTSSTYNFNPSLRPRSNNIFLSSTTSLPLGSKPPSKHPYYVKDQPANIGYYTEPWATSRGTARPDLASSQVRVSTPMSVSLARMMQAAEYSMPGPLEPEIPTHMRTLPLGRPPECMQLGDGGVASPVAVDTDSVPCQMYCCSVENEDAFDNMEPVIPRSSTVRTIKTTTSPTTTASTSTTHGQQAVAAQNISVLSSAQPAVEKQKLPSNDVVNNAGIKNEVKNIKKTRIARDADEWVDAENSNIYTGETDFEVNGVSVSLHGPYVNQTLGPSFCQSECSMNISYSIPISKYMPDNHLELQFHFPREHPQYVEHCELPVDHNDCGPRGMVYSPLDDMTGNFKYEISIGYVHSKFRFRTSATRAVNICELGKEQLGNEYTEYNFHFYRDCDE